MLTLGSGGLFFAHDFIAHASRVGSAHHGHDRIPPPALDEQPGDTKGQLTDSATFGLIVSAEPADALIPEPA